MCATPNLRHYRLQGPLLNVSSFQLMPKNVLGGGFVEFKSEISQNQIDAGIFITINKTST